MKKSVIIIIAVLLAIVLHVTFNCNGEGIIILEGYSHGVALCEGGEDVDLETVGEAHMWKKDGILYVINLGHLNDQEVEKLKVLAIDSCAKYSNN